ncbi:multiprotein bridging factor aMBF1 [Candidatus Hecatella orcuttiae]|jgi:putative transcription factor|uniref:multiprotein bridging factor aMBF1 n=1 Tax=Candidatus Hecatella orcuttiae TaxID=1935119 RepID=UPI00286802BE|nr:multiprotein bridging factor aMBF1 [Candidatus Hecatella orcuttiae]
MLCEVCGRTIRSQPRRAVIEGALLQVCDDCAKHASSTWGERGRPSPKTFSSKPGRAGRVKIEEEDYVMVEDYGQKIKRAREARGWSQEELARRINEKASFIGKVETEKVVPSLEVAKKLQHIFGFPLLTQTASLPSSPAPLQSKTLELTLGDIAVFENRGKKSGRSEAHSG